MIKPDKAGSVEHFEIFKTLFAGLFLVTVVSITSHIYSESQKTEQTKSQSSPQSSSVINTQIIKTPAPSTSLTNSTKKVTQPSPSSESSHVKCNISAKCGGGYKEMLKSTCEEMVCCTYSLEYPPVFTSRLDCENRAKQYTTPALTPSWDYQYSPAPSTSNSQQITESELKKQQINSCLTGWDKWMYDTMALCAVHNGIQDSYCLSQAQETAGREKASCLNL